ncbi:GNAT family N-acetyltransferase [Streptomyces sp. YU58]|uniref:GNAT family N-acetyltransferase n=1 Tax=Streptomyces sp. SX92 TaxID=3158972 RepID=UPI0027BA0A1A|nr:GNAT family N-acetyltransferase [Streptomyces coralus]WLW58765.1 GNAT family N-acetyltransferase [Streptomyces coralus]
MDIPVVRLDAPATATAPALVLRPWREADAPALVAVYRDDDLLRRWTSPGPQDEPAAVRWVRGQRQGWETGQRYAFAVVEEDGRTPGGTLAGHAVLKPRAGAAEVGYWTAAHARGRGVAPRALQALTDWAFTAFTADDIPRIDLLHRVDNTASCRVADKCGYPFAELMPAAPPAFPRQGHRHVRVREGSEGSRRAPRPGA